MFLEQLQLLQFRNYANQGMHFHAPKTILVGDNAQGKSNLLEAIQLLTMLKSYRVHRDADLIRSGASMGEVRGHCQRHQAPVELSLCLRPNHRRTMVVNGVKVKKKDEFLGNLNAVLFSSLDLELVRGGPADRRDWMDGVLIQLEPVYLGLHHAYEQILRQRNALLRSVRQGKIRFDALQMELWNEQLITIGTQLIRRRLRLVDRLQPLADQWHRAISGGQEKIELRYLTRFPCTATDTLSILEAAFRAHLHTRSVAEQQQGSSLVGPHRDDLQLHINATPAKEYGSQGQQRTLVLALKLAELALIETVIGEPPLLLLDDVLAELDLQRQSALLEAVQSRVQTILTTTHLQSFDAQWLDAATVFSIKAGVCQPLPLV